MIYWLAGIGVGGYLLYNYYIDPYIALPGPIGTVIYKRRSQVTQEELSFKRQVESGQIKT